SRWLGRTRNWMLAFIWRWWKSEPSSGARPYRLWLMKRDGFRARVVNFSDAPFSDASAGMRSSVRSRRRSRVFRRRAYGCRILIATNLSTCSRLSSKSLGGLRAGWITFAFGILVALGENRRVSEWNVGYNRLV